MDAVEQVRHCEELLRQAMLSGDSEALSLLEDDRLVFTGPDGMVIGKEQDLYVHKAGMLSLSSLRFEDTKFQTIKDLVVVTTSVSPTGTFGGSPIDGKFAHTRGWSLSDHNWRVIVGHAGAFGK